MEKQGNIGKHGTTRESMGINGRPAELKGAEKTDNG